MNSFKAIGIYVYLGNNPQHLFLTVFRRNTLDLGGGGQNLSWVLGTLIYKEVKVKVATFISNQSLIYIHPFLPLSPQFFNLPLLTSVATGKLFFGRKKNIEGGTFAPLSTPPQVAPMPPSFWRLPFHCVRELTQNVTSQTADSFV